MEQVNELRQALWNLRQSLTGYRYSFTNEAELQEAIANVLTEIGVKHEREVALSPRERIDFLLMSGIGLEVKEIAGSPSKVMRQLARYASSDRITCLALVTARHCHIHLPSEIGDKPLIVISLAGGSL
jgi:hypothetical protein